MMKKVTLFLLLYIAFNINAQQVTLEFCSVPKVSHKKVDFTFCSVPQSNDFSFGICWSQNPSPTLFNTFSLFTETSERFLFSANQLQPNTNYYFRIFHLFKDGSVFYYPEFVETTLPEVKIGDYYKGGIVVYLYKPKDSLYVDGEQHGLIMSQNDLGFANWGNKGQATVGGTSIKIGHGKKNTESILSNFPQSNSVNTQLNTLNSSNLRVIHPNAALLCKNFESDGYQDWFLPSNGEWHAIFPKIDSLTNLKINNYEYYWSSSEVFISWKLKKSKRKTTKSQYRSAWAIRIHSQLLISSAMTRKNSVARVRAMRYF